MDSDGRARFRGSKRSPLPEVVASEWAKDGRDRKGPTSSVISAPDVTKSADVWLLGSHVLSRLLDGVAGGLPEPWRSILTTLLASTKATNPADRPTMCELQGKLEAMSTGLKEAAGRH
jgi:hypothetical protein